jgi:hypothetical protein
VSSTERVRKWRAEQRRKAQLYDQVEAARRAYLMGQVAAFRVEDPDFERAQRLVARALDDQFCFDVFSILDKA